MPDMTNAYRPPRPGGTAAGWTVRPPRAAEVAADAGLVAASFAHIRPSLPGLAVRLAGPADTPLIAEIEAQGFDALRKTPRRPGGALPGPEYDAALWCGNRMGRVLRMVAQDARGVVGYGLVQVRRTEVYIAEICVLGGAGRPGHDLFHTQVMLAHLLDHARITAMLTRPDRRRGLARLYARVGMAPAPRRGFPLTGGPMPQGAIWLEGSVAALRARIDTPITIKEATHGRQEKQPPRPEGDREPDLDRVDDHHRAVSDPL